MIDSSYCGYFIDYFLLFFLLSFVIVLLLIFLLSLLFFSLYIFFFSLYLSFFIPNNLYCYVYVYFIIYSKISEGVIGFYYIFKPRIYDRSFMARIDRSFMGSFFSLAVSQFDTCFEGDFLLLLFLLFLILFYLLNYDYA